MKHTLQYTKHAKKDLDKMDIAAAKRIIRKLVFFCNQSDPFAFSKALTGEFKDLFRFRIGNYRAIFHKDAKGKITILTILTIKHRGDIYQS